MKRALSKVKGLYYYNKDGKKIYAFPDWIWGDFAGISGHVTGIRGDATGIRGDVTGIRENIDDCELTDEEREKGIDIQELIVTIDDCELRELIVIGE